MKNTNRILGLLLAATLVGCSYFQAPPIAAPDIPRAWNNGESENLLMSSESLASLQWWRQFHDPRLNALIESALNNNSDVKIALSNIDNAQAQLKQVELSWIPTLPLLLGFSDMPTLGSPGYFIGIFPSYTLNIFGQIKAQQQAKEQVKVSQAAMNGVKLTVIGQTANAYFTWLSQQQQLQLTTELLATYQSRLASYRGQLAQGLIDAKTVANADSDVMQAMGQIETIKNNLVVSQNSLRYLINQNPGSLTTRGNFTTLSIESVVTAGLPLAILANRPDVNAALTQIAASNAGIGVAVANLLPSIQLDTLLAKNAPTTSQLSSPGNMAMGDAYATMPLLNAKVFGQIDAAKVQKSKDYYVYEQTVKKALRDIENDLAANQLYTTRYQHFVAANLSLQQGCANDLAQFRNGLTNLTTVYECQAGVTQAQLALVQTKLDLLLVRVALYQDLGGGYNSQGTTINHE